MIISKINTENNINSYFGKSKKTETDKVSENFNNKANNRKKLALTLTFLAIAGVAAVAYKNPKVKDKLGLLKNKINKGFSGVKPNKMQKEAACATGFATVLGAVAVAEGQKTKKTADNPVPEARQEEPKDKQPDKIIDIPVKPIAQEDDKQTGLNAETATKPKETPKGVLPAVSTEEDLQEPIVILPMAFEEEAHAGQTKQGVKTGTLVAEEETPDKQSIQNNGLNTEPKETEETNTAFSAATVEEDDQQDEQSGQTSVTVLESKGTGKEEQVAAVNSANAIEGEKGQDYMFFDEFKKANGNFHKGKAYLGSELFTGSFAIQDGNKQTFFDYENGELKSAEIGVITAEGLFEPQKLKTYRTDKDGTKIIKIKTRKFTDRKDKTAPVQWHTDTIYKVTDSDVTITQRDTFDQELTTYFKKQKNGTWKGFYEDRQFDYGIGNYIVPRDVYTDELVKPRELKKYFSITLPKMKNPYVNRFLSAFRSPKTRDLGP